MDKYKALTTQGKDVYMQALVDIGWFEIKQNNKNKIKEKLNELEEYNMEFVSTLYHVWFDTEGFDNDESYETLLSTILEISNLDVLLKKVEYKTDNSLSISVKTKRSTYSYEIDLEEFGDWIDGNFIDIFINNEVLNSENIESRFLPLPLFDQTVQFVFIPQSLYDKAIEKGVIPEELDYFMEK